MCTRTRTLEHMELEPREHGCTYGVRVRRPPKYKFNMRMRKHNQNLELALALAL